MRKRIIARLLCFVAVVDVIAVYLYANACSYVFNVAKADFQSAISNIVYDCLSDSSVGENLKDMCSVVTDVSGKVSFVSTDGVLANALCVAISKKTYDGLKKYVEKGVSLPIGAFSGVRLLSGVGKRVDVKLITVVGVKCNFRSQSESAGINQTRQRLYILVEPQIKAVVAGKTYENVESVEVLCFDNLIVGEVPEVYLNTK